MPFFGALIREVYEQVPGRGNNSCPPGCAILARTNHAPLRKFGQRLQGWSFFPRIVVPEDERHRHEQVSQALDDYRGRKNQCAVSLEPKLELPRPYRAGSTKWTFREWLSLQGGMVDPATIVQTSKKWAGWGPLLAFSEIYFSESQTIALVWGGVINDSLRGRRLVCPGEESWPVESTSLDQRQLARALSSEMENYGNCCCSR